MPDIPASSLLSYLGVIFLLSGGVLFLIGLEVIELGAVKAVKGSKAITTGGILMLLGVGALLPEIIGLSRGVISTPVATSSPVVSPDVPTVILSLLPTDTPLPPTNTLLPPTPTPTPSDMVYVPAGKFWMGSSDEDIDAILAVCSECKREVFIHEQLQHEVYLDAFWIDRTEVTNGQYKRCVEAGACTWPQSSASDTRGNYYGHPDFDDYPVIHVDWDQANAYCRWAGKRLPTEAEWEKAARGTDKRLYPWGNEAPDEARLNYDNNVGDTTEVGSYPGGASPYDALDMSGNVWEWTSSLRKPYPYMKGDGREDPVADEVRIVRGGSWYNPQRSVRAAYRDVHEPSTATTNVGFRCARTDSES